MLHNTSNISNSLNTVLSDHSTILHKTHTKNNATMKYSYLTCLTSWLPCGDSEDQCFPPKPGLWLGFLDKMIRRVSSLNRLVLMSCTLLWREIQTNITCYQNTHLILCYIKSTHLMTASNAMPNESSLPQVRYQLWQMCWLPHGFAFRYPHCWKILI